MLCIKAREFWDKLPCYAEKEPPKFLHGWLRGIKRQYDLNKRQHYKKGAFAQINDKSVRMTEIRAAVKEYEPELT